MRTGYGSAVACAATSSCAGREAALAFQRTVLRAWRAVDDALTADAEAQHRRAAAARAVTQDEIAQRAARQRHTEDVVDFLDVNSTKAQSLRSRNDLADSDVQIATELVTPYRALGGGWQVVDPPGPLAGPLAISGAAR